LAIGGVALWAWQYLHPVLPTVNVNNANLQYALTGASASAPTPSSYILNTTMTFDMVLGNPNTKIGIWYDQISFGLGLYTYDLGEDTIPAFYLGYNVTATKQVKLVSGPVVISAADESVLATAQVAGSVPMNLQVVVKIRIQIASYATPPLNLGLNCDILVDPSASAGNQLKNMSCKFSLKL
jgi:hypothetical protein